MYHQLLLGKHGCALTALQLEFAMQRQPGTVGGAGGRCCVLMGSCRERREKPWSWCEEYCAVGIRPTYYARFRLLMFLIDFGAN